MNATTNHAIGFAKGKERYLFLYDDSTREEVLLKFGQFASHPELSFNWYDCAALSMKVRGEQRAEARRLG